MNNIKTIHQFTPSIATGDGVSNSLLYIQKLLKELNFNSNIYVAKEHIDIEFKHDIYHIDEYKPSKTQILFYHHSIGHEHHDKIMHFADEKIMIYHNITPAHFFKHNAYIQKLCIQGREQLSKSAKYFIASIGDSDYNCKELRYHNYPDPTSLSLLVDLQKQISHKPSPKVLQKNIHTYNIIFIGRVVSNKSQHRLIDLAYALKEKGVKDFKIHIVGGASEPPYMDFIKQYRENLNLLDEVEITGKVTNEELVAYYMIADLYLSLSNHEGFGMPLVEAMKFDTPVLAYDIGGISSTLPKQSLLKSKSISYVVAKIIKLQNDPHLKTELIKNQRLKLKTFSNQNIKNQLQEYLKKQITK